MPLPPAPSSVAERGRPLLGAYQGYIPRVDWRDVPAPWWWRRLHHKRWHYASILGAECVVAAAVVDLGWAATGFAYAFERERRRLCDRSALALSARVSEAPAAGESRLVGLGLSIVLAREGTSWRLRVTARDLTIDATLQANTSVPPLCAVAPIDGGVANCTHKTTGLTATGRASVEGRSYDLSGSAGALDHTNGLLARDTTWRWVSGHGDRVGLNLVDGFNGPVENVVWLDGEVHPVGRARIQYDRPLSPWTVRTEDGCVDLVFSPEGMRGEDRNLLLARSRYVQPIGTFRGTLRARPDAAPVVVENLCGVTEDHLARW